MHVKGPKITFPVARYMKKSKDFVRKWLNRYKEVGNVDDFPERGKRSVSLQKKRIVNK